MRQCIWLEMQREVQRLNLTHTKILCLMSTLDGVQCQDQGQRTTLAWLILCILVLLCALMNPVLKCYCKMLMLYQVTRDNHNSEIPWKENQQLVTKDLYVKIIAA